MSRKRLNLGRFSVHNSSRIKYNETGPVPKFSLDSFLPYQLAALSSRVSREFAKTYVSKFGITIPEWRVIFHLHTSGPVSVREIFQRVDMDKSKVSRAASRLEESGLISKKTNPADRRLVELELTQKGRDLMSKITPLALDYERQLMAKLGEQGPAFRETLAHFLKDDE